jgi:DNA-binding Lrp family transcriptional regulator
MTSSERVRALRAEGVIRGYHADVALEALGRHAQALIAVRVRPPSRQNIEAFRDWAVALPELIGVLQRDHSAGARRNGRSRQWRKRSHPG